MSRSSERKGLIEPLPALAAVLVVGVALGLYADALTTVEPSQSETGAAEATLQSVHETITDDGAARPRRLPDARADGHAGYQINCSLSAAGRRWTVGPAPPERASVATRSTPVVLDRWTVRPGRLAVVVWT